MIDGSEMIDVFAPVDFSCSRGKKFAATKTQFLIFIFEKHVAKKWARFCGKKDRKREATPDYEKFKKNCVCFVICYVFSALCYVFLVLVLILCYLLLLLLLFVFVVLCSCCLFVFFVLVCVRCVLLFVIVLVLC